MRMAIEALILGIGLYHLLKPVYHDTSKKKAEMKSKHYGTFE